MIALIVELAIFSIGISFLELYESLQAVWNGVKDRSVGNVSFITLV
tara:strand:- start:38 stop:175 length:138 start_codon:yes stop_codon:yes gene_type:complete